MARKSDRSSEKSYWDDQFSKSMKAYSAFQASGDTVVDKYRIEKSGAENTALVARLAGQARYNILYSSTETIRPSLYAQTPKIEAVKRHKDRTDDLLTTAVNILESSVQYAIEELDFDDVIENVIEDYTLPGLGTAWVRYEATFKDQYSSDGKAVLEDDGKTVAQELDVEGLGFDYVYWKDFLTGVARTWAEVPWVARRVYMDKAAATKRFGTEIAAGLQFTSNSGLNRSERGDTVNNGNQAIIWEVWHKKSKTVLWYSQNHPDGILDSKPDILKLKKFFPCPRPLRAISNTRTIVPRCFYSQYQAQAEEIDELTGRIRHLTQALVVRGVYNGSQDELKMLLATAGGNKMIPIQDWAGFIGQNGGVAGAIQWVPIREIVTVLMELLKARDIAKSEVYEISGFSDIQRGVSKASETLGAQEIKTDWASARLKKMQKEVQRFIRDIVRIMGEIICEHFTPETLALYTGFTPPQAAPAQPPQPGQQPAPDPRQQAIELFKGAVDMLRSERERCAVLNIETDSTLLPDEDAERKDRLEFLGQIGAFMQQAAPMIQQFPDMRGLLASIMMFSVRTFRASRPIEQEFEKFQQLMENMPPSPPPGEGGDPHAAQAQVQSETIKAQTTMQSAQIAAQQDKYKVDVQAQIDAMKEKNRHDEKMAELQVQSAQLQLKQQELHIKSFETQRTVALSELQQQHDASRDMAAHALSQRQQGMAEQQQSAAQAADQERLSLERQQADTAQFGA